MVASAGEAEDSLSLPRIAVRRRGADLIDPRGDRRVPGRRSPRRRCESCPSPVAATPVLALVELEPLPERADGQPPGPRRPGVANAYAIARRDSRARARATLPRPLAGRARRHRDRPRPAVLVTTRLAGPCLSLDGGSPGCHRQPARRDAADACAVGPVGCHPRRDRRWRVLPEGVFAGLPDRARDHTSPRRIRPEPAPERGSRRRGGELAPHGRHRQDLRRRRAGRSLAGWARCAGRHSAPLVGSDR